MTPSSQLDRANMNIFSPLRLHNKQAQAHIRESRKEYHDVKHAGRTYHVHPDMIFHCQLCRCAYPNYWIADATWHKLPPKIQNKAICPECFETIVALQKTHTITEKR